MDAQGGVDSLLGRLSSVLVDEAKLLGGLRGTVEFINDELKSMNALLLHLTESQHRDHPVRAWMGQLVGLSRDCAGNVELYIRYVAAGDRSKGILGFFEGIIQSLRTMRAHHRSTVRMRACKLGDRRIRDGSAVPLAAAAAADQYIPRRATLDAELPEDEDILEKENVDLSSGG